LSCDRPTIGGDTENDDPRRIPVPAIRSAAAAALACIACLGAPASRAQTVGPATFVNGIAVPGDTPDRTAGSAFDRRLGFFSDLAYDPLRREWWALSDRGPGGGTLDYATRAQRFTLDVAANGAISNFRVVETVLFANGSLALDGRAPASPGVLGNAFDPEGMVVLPNGHFLVSDEYGPSLLEFDRTGQLVRRFDVPENLVPRTAAGVDHNAPAASLVSGREGNRGLEGLALDPGGRFAYAMLQNGAIQDGFSNGNRGLYTRIVKYDVATGAAVAQYAYRLDAASQGRGISAIVALGNDRFLVLERNNRGVGVGATLANADKNVFAVDLSGATDVSGIALPASGALPAGVVAAAKGAKVVDLDADTLAALGGRSPEKWEGLAIGPQLANGQFLILAGTDNDYSVTQNGTGTQFDVWFRFADADPYAGSIQCPIGSTGNCTFTADGTAATLNAEHALLPGVLHAYTASIAGLVTPVPEPETVALLGAGLLFLVTQARRRPGRARRA
jgi:hypothetical protein